MKLAHLTQSCAHCTLRHLCLPEGLSTAKRQAFERIVHRPDRVKKGQPLIQAGTRLKHHLIVRTGSLKIVLPADDGFQAIVGFALAGERVGLNAIDSGRHPSSAIALEATGVCLVPHQGLEDLVGQHPEFRRHFLRVLSERIAADETRMALMGRGSAEQRLAAFLLGLSQRFHARGLVADRFRLSMSRADIAQHLGLTRETITRLLTQFRHQRVIDLRVRDLQIRDSERLHRMAGMSFERLSRIA